ncbi:flagellar assembly protein FliW [Paenarthrobacter sp. C1]|uniref:flagellar assembly protein FliW n=1 Tax=Paenarthrobacter sp. C1 TaxID=3400220 RepID=UPI003BF533C7
MTTTWDLPRGLLGFPDLTSLEFTPLPDTDVYGVLADPDTGLQFVLALAGAFFPDYEIDVPDASWQQLGLTDPKDAAVWVVVTQRGEGSFTANLRGPVVVNPATSTAVQVVLDDSHATSAALVAA